MCGQRVCAATECRCNNIPYTFHSWNGERGEERRWEGEQREREREKGDRGMTYIWPTGRRVELLIQFALKHSLRFISFPISFTSTISRLPFFSLPLATPPSTPFVFVEFIYRGALFRQCCASPLSLPPPPRNPHPRKLLEKGRWY